jgi:hypothetical protein
MMNKLLCGLLATFLLVALVHSHPHNTPSCPMGSSFLTLHHGHLTIASGSMVNIQAGIDSLCYDYTLPSPFQQRPGVAMAVSKW